MFHRYLHGYASMFIVLSLISTPASQRLVAAASDFEAQKVDAYVLERMKTLNIPGVAIGIVRGDRVVYAQGYGVADDTGRAMTPDTPFLIASLSKSITALGIMQLVDSGKINLDAPAQTYLPWFRVADPGASAKITVRHLLHQTSGFDEREGYSRNLSADLSDDALETSIRALSAASLKFSPGEAFEYSNTNYDILGLLLQAVSGQSYEAYVEKNIFAPLDMDQSSTSLEEARAAKLTRGYIPIFGVTTAYDHLMPYSRIVKPSAGLISSAEDLTHYLIAHLNQGQYRGNTLVSSDGMAKLHTAGIPISGNAGYAMGWTVFSFPEMAPATVRRSVPMVLSHAGEWAGYTSLLVFIPELQTGIALLMNKHDPAQMPELFSVGWSLSMLAVGLEPLAPQSADFIGRNIRALLVVIVALLGIGMVWAARKLRQLNANFGRHAQNRRKLAMQMSLLAIVDLALAGGLLFVRLPESKDTLALALRFNPDIGLMYVLLLGLTLGWGAIRTLLSLRLFRKSTRLETAS